MAPEDNPADDDEHGECAREIEELKAQLSVMERACGNWREFPIVASGDGSTRRDYTDSDWQAGARAIIERDQLRSEVNNLQVSLADETAIVDRVWKALGIFTMDKANGKAIDELVSDLKRRVAQSAAWESKCLLLATKIVQKHGGIGEGGHMIDRLIFIDAKLTELEERLKKSCQPNSSMICERCDMPLVPGQPCPDCDPDARLEAALKQSYDDLAASGGIVDAP